jgi:hypothetical protein
VRARRRSCGPALLLPLLLAAAGCAGLLPRGETELSRPTLLDPAAPPAAPSAAGELEALLPEVHGFVSQGYIKSVENSYLVDSRRGSFDFSEAALNFTKGLGDRLRIGLQLFSQDLGARQGAFSVSVDWLFLDYHFRDWLGLRAGRTKLPFGLYNEINDIDAARVPVLLPQAVYPLLNRDILLAQTGVELYGYLPIDRYGALDYRLYGGTLTANPPAVAPPAVLKTFQVPYVAGARLLWETPLEGLRAGVSVQALRFDYAVALSPSSTNLSVRAPFLLWLGSAEYNAHELTLAAEYGRWSADVETNFAPTTTVTNERYYLSGAYRIFPWLAPGLYYSSLVPDVSKSGTASYQHDLAATLRVDLNAHWLFKLEGHFVRGTADLTADLNEGVPPASLQRDWAAFFAKTTVYY